MKPIYVMLGDEEYHPSVARDDGVLLVSETGDQVHVSERQERVLHLVHYETDWVIHYERTMDAQGRPHYRVLELCTNDGHQVYRPVPTTRWSVWEVDGYELDAIPFGDGNDLLHVACRVDWDGTDPAVYDQCIVEIRVGSHDVGGRLDCILIVRFVDFLR